MNKESVDVSKKKERAYIIMAFVYKLHNFTKYLASSALRRIELLVKRTDLMVPSESEEGMNNTSPPCWLASHTMAKENMLKNLVKMQVEPLSSLHNFR